MSDFLSERESAILGQEFLTWLWYLSEAEPMFKDPEGRHTEVHMAARVSVTGGSGEARSTAVVSGETSRLEEARLGLSTGKKVDKAQIKFVSDGEEWTLTLRAEDFAISGPKTPKVETSRDQGEDPDAAWLEKIYLLERALTCLDALYIRVLNARLRPGAWDAESAKVRDWLAQG